MKSVYELILSEIQKFIKNLNISKLLFLNSDELKRRVLSDDY